jgi:hypothetical protein
VDWIHVSLKNCYGLDLLHAFIYKTYLLHKEALLEKQLLAIQHQWNITYSEEKNVTPYEEFLEILKQKEDDGHRETAEDDPKIQPKLDETPHPTSAATQESVRPEEEKQPTPNLRSPSFPWNRKKQDEQRPPSDQLGKEALEAFLASSDEENEIPQRKFHRSVSSSSDDEEDDDFFYDESGQRRFNHERHSKRYYANESTNRDSDDEASHLEVAHTHRRPVTKDENDFNTNERKVPREEQQSSLDGLSKVEDEGNANNEQSKNSIRSEDHSDNFPQSEGHADEVEDGENNSGDLETNRSDSVPPPDDVSNGEAENGEQSYETNRSIVHQTLSSPTDDDSVEDDDYMITLTPANIAVQEDDDYVIEHPSNTLISDVIQTHREDVSNGTQPKANGPSENNASEQDVQSSSYEQCQADISGDEGPQDKDKNEEEAGHQKRRSDDLEGRQGDSKEDGNLTSVQQQHNIEPSSRLTGANSAAGNGLSEAAMSAVAAAQREAELMLQNQQLYTYSDERKAKEKKSKKKKEDKSSEKKKKKKKKETMAGE